MTKLEEEAQTRLAVAALFVALARALGERDEGLQDRFGAELHQLYARMRDSPDPPTGAMETLWWTGDLLKSG